MEPESAKASHPSSRMKILTIVLLVVLTIGLIASGLFIVTLQKSVKKAQSDSENLAKTIASASELPELPSNAVKVSECIPFEGEHWVVPESVPNGPFYTVHNGKITSVEYMFVEKDLPGKESSTATPEQAMEFMKKNNLSLADLVQSLTYRYDLFDYKYNSIDIHWSSPHAGLPVPHIDIHLYLAAPEVLSQICPDAKIEDVDSPEVLKNIKENNIPYPGSPTASPSAR